jgi:hypothetical protein
MTCLVLIHNPSLQLFIPPIIAILLFGDFVNGEMLQAGVLRKKFGMAGLAYTRRACNNNVGARSHFEKRGEIVRELWTIILWREILMLGGGL